MDPNNLQNTLNGAGGQQNPHGNFNGVPPNPGAFAHQMAQAGGAQQQAGQYNPMLLQQPYVNFGFGGMNYNNPMFDFQAQQQQQFLMQQQHQQMHRQHQQNPAHSQQQQLPQQLPQHHQHHHNMAFVQQQQQMLQQMLQNPQQPMAQHPTTSSNQFQQHQPQHQQPQQVPSSSSMLESSTHQKLYEAQRRQIEQQQKEQAELLRLKRKEEQEEQKKLAEEAKKKQKQEEKRLAEEMQRRREEQERERLEELKRKEEQKKRDEERRIAEEKIRIEQERMHIFAAEQFQKEEEANRQRNDMENRFRQVGAQPLTLVGTHFMPNFLDMIPYPYESMVDSSLPQVFDLSRDGAILCSTDPQMVAAISKALNNTDVDDIVTRMDKLRPEDKENNDLFINQLPMMIQAVVEHSTSALDVDSHNDLELLENEDVMMTEDITRTTTQSTSSGFNFQHRMAMNTSAPSTSSTSQTTMNDTNHADTSSSHMDVEPAPMSMEKRRQMMSVGKAPKAGGGGQTQRKNKRDIENLNDSLTGNFIPTDSGRRARRRGRASEDDDEETLQRDLKLIAAMEEGVKLPTSVTGFTDNDESINQFFENRKKRKKEEPKVTRDRPPTPESDIASRDAEWQERLRLKQEREKTRKADEEHQNAWSLQSLAENETYNRFCQNVDGVLEAAEGLDSELMMPKKKKKKRRSDASMSKGDAEMDESEEEEENDEIEENLKIELGVLEELRRGSTRLRENSVLQALGADRLMKLVVMLDRNIRDAISADNTRLLVPCNDDDDTGHLIDRDSVEERLKRASDAAVIALNVMSSHRMFKQVIIEDVIDRCIGLTRLLLIHLIYPASDSVYRMVNTKKKDRGQDESKRRKKIGTCSRDHVTEYVYERITEVVWLLAVLAKSDSMTDTSVHNIASVALTPFFVANVGSLQVSAMLLASNIFSRAEDSLRFSMITDFLSSLHRAPQYTQKNTNNGYTLPDGSWISTTTALFITLVQATIKVPKHKKNVDEEEAAKRAKKDEALVKEAFLQASKVTNAFLNGFLAKCSQKGSKMDGEEDYRILFSNFLQELLVALNSPEWPAAEMILTALGSVLVKNFRAKSTEMTLRQASLDYLGNITAKLRKDMKDAIVGEKRLDEVVKKAFYLMDDKGYDRYEAVDISELTQNDKLKILEGALIDYLVISNPSDIVVYACTFYVGEWYKETVEDMDSARSKHKNMMETSETEKEQRKAEKKYERMMKRGADMKEFLSKLLDKKEIKRRLEKSSKVKMMDSDALWAVKYLAQSREFSHSFETYLKHIVFGAGSETIVALRSKALKCLSSIIEADYNVLILEDVQQAVHSRMVDSHAQVRESAVELIGRFVLYDEEYVRRYYSQIAERILDTGVAVRKRVIRIMREICERFPTFEMIPDMLSRMIRRVSDEEGVKKLVYDTFTTLWFQPVDKRVNPNAVATKVTTMCSVAQHCIKDNVNDYVEQLILEIVKGGTEASGMFVAVKQIVDSLVEHILNLEMRKSKDDITETEMVYLKNQEDKYMAYLSTLAVFSKIKPKLLVHHVEVLLPYLTFTGSKTNTENQVTKEMIGMLERVIPLIPFPNNEMLESIDDNLSKVILYNGMAMVVTAVSCASAIYQKFHRGAKRCIGVFANYMKTMECAKRSYEQGKNPFEARMIPIFSRTLFTLGVLSRYFPFEEFVALTDTNVNEKTVEKLKDKVFVLLEFYTRISAGGLRQKALTALGHFCAEHSEYLTKKQLTKTYIKILNDVDSLQSIQERVLVLQNLEMFLQCEEHKLATSNTKWEENKEAQNLKEMELSGSGLGSSVIQNYWKAVLESYMDPDVKLRRASVQVVWLTLSQGLVTPGASIPTLIAMTTDPVEQIRNRIDPLLKDTDAKYGGMVQAMAMHGVRLAYKLHRTLQNRSPQKLVRGFRFSDFHTSMSSHPDALPDKTHDASAVLSAVYQSLRTNKPHRRSFQQSMVKLFSDGQKEGMQLPEYIFMADNLAMFPYQMIEEVLYVIHTVNHNITLSGQAIAAAYAKLLNSGAGNDETQADLVVKLEQCEDYEALKRLYYESQVPTLLLYVRRFLMQLYGFNEQKVTDYMPSDGSKTNDKAVTRRNIAMFKPATVLESFNVPFDTPSMELYAFLADNIVQFRSMLLVLDRTDAVEVSNNVTVANQDDDYDDEEAMDVESEPSTSGAVPVEQ